MTANPVSYETFQLKSASVSLEVLCEQGVGQGEVGMFTQRVKAVWSCLGLMFSQSQLVGRYNSQMDLENTLANSFSNYLAS